MNRKLLSSIAAMLAACLAANAYDYLTFETTDGSTHSFAAESLVITFEDGMLVADNGNSVSSLPLAGLSKMYFSAATTAISEATMADGDGRVTVYAVSGACLGQYASAALAKATLRSGMYILKSGSRTEKVVIR